HFQVSDVFRGNFIQRRKSVAQKISRIGQPGPRLLVGIHNPFERHLSESRSSQNGAQRPRAKRSHCFPRCEARYATKSCSSVALRTPSNGGIGVSLRSFFNSFNSCFRKL